MIIIETQKLTFSTEGQFITNIAREKLYQSHDLKTAVSILMSCLCTDELSYDERQMLALKILNKDAEIVGTYPNSDYGVDEINEESDLHNISELIASLSQKLSETEQKLNKIEQKFNFIQFNISSYEKTEMNDLYRSDYDEKLFDENDESESVSSSYNNTMLQSFFRRLENEPDKDDYGWLDPNGKFHPVEWGCHMEWAQDYLDKHYPFGENPELYRISNDPKDIMVYSLHWVLLHNPGMGVAVMTYDEKSGVTPAQKNFLYAYYKERNEKSKMVEVNYMKIRKEQSNV